MALGWDESYRALGQTLVCLNRICNPTITHGQVCLAACVSNAAIYENMIGTPHPLPGIRE